MRIAKLIGAAVISTLVMSGAAKANIIVDGLLDADYGASKSTVTYAPGTLESNFGTPTPFTDAIGYQIYLKEQAGYVYGFLQSGGAGKAVAPFANLYFDLDPQNGNGSDLGFELGGNHPNSANAFVPGVDGSAQVTNIMTVLSGDGTGIEFAIPDTDFTTAIPGLSSYPLDHAGGQLTLRLSQSFGYSVAGGELYGPDRLGSVTLGVSAVPLPASLPMFGAALLGLAAVGYRVKRRTASTPAA